MRKFWVYDLPQWDAIDMTSLLKFQFLFFSVPNPFQFSLAIYCLGTGLSVASFEFRAGLLKNLCCFSICAS